MVSAKLVALQRELSDVKAECDALKTERTTNEKVTEACAYSEQLKTERDAVIAELLDVKAERDSLHAAKQHLLEVHDRMLKENEQLCAAANVRNPAHCDCCKTAQTNLTDLCDAAQATLEEPDLESPDALIDGLVEMKRHRRNLRDVLARVRPKPAN